jgi:predicted nucleic acid-binding protein
MPILIDSNVLLDVLTEDARWFAWSSEALADAAERDVVAINPIIYAEVSVGFTRIEDLDAAVPATTVHRLALPWEAAFLAGKCCVAYRRRGGTRVSPLADFYIGAHASVSRLVLLTRDAQRYRSYFPRLKLISPT